MLGHNAHTPTHTTMIPFRPGPREIPGCTGQCPLTYCGACYFAKQVRSLPKGCGDCGSPISSLECLEVWADCIHNADVIQYGEVSKYMDFMLIHVYNYYNTSISISPLTC